MSTHSRHTTDDALHQELAKFIDGALNGVKLGLAPKKNGFVLLTFEFGKMEGGRINYVSNGRRADIITALKEILGRFEGHDHDHPTTPQ